MLRCGEKTASAQARDLSGVPCKHQARRIENQHRYLFAALSAELTHVVIAICPTQLTTNKPCATDECRLAKQQSARLVNSGATQRGC